MRRLITDCKPRFISQWLHKLNNWPLAHTLSFYASIRLLHKPMVRIVHIVRGRLRLRMDAVKSQPRLAARIHEHLTAVSGIRRVEVKSRTGSVLLTYDPRALGSADFLDELSLAMGTLFPAYFAPGRAHIRVDLLKGRPQLVSRIQQLLAPVEGIHRLEIDPSDGACLLVYDSRTVTSPEFIDAVSRPLAALLPQLDVRKIISRTGLGASNRCGNRD